MGIKGSRKKSSAAERYKEPDLLVGVESILKSAKIKGLYSGDSLDIEEVVRSFDDIELRYEPMEVNKSGSLLYSEGRWIIRVNANHNKNRQRFTIAHELGHYILHKEKKVEFVDTTFFRSDEMHSVEYNANEFAARLLMPETEIRRLIDVELIKNVGELARRFEVSAAAMKYRVVSLGYKMKNNG